MFSHRDSYLKLRLLMVPRYPKQYRYQYIILDDSGTGDVFTKCTLIIHISSIFYFLYLPLISMPHLQSIAFFSYLELNTILGRLDCIDSVV